MLYLQFSNQSGLKATTRLHYMNLAPIFVIVSLFWLLFSGGSDIAGIRVFPFAVGIVAIFVLSCKNYKAVFSRDSLILFAILLPIFITSTLIDYEYYYPMWIIHSIVTFFCLGIIFSYIRRNENYKPFILGLSLSSLAMLSFFVIGTSLSGGQRGSFVFGPNMLYRIFAVLSLFPLLLIKFKDSFWSRFRLIALTMLLLTLGVIATGSRGGIIAIVIVLIAMFHSWRGKINVWRMIIFSLPIASLLSIFVIGNPDIIVGSRLFNFDYEGNQSLALRVAPWIDFTNNFSDWVFGIGQSYETFLSKFGHEQFPYPHNLFLELVFFNGIFGFVLSVFLILYFIKLTFNVLPSQFDSYSVLYYCLTINLVGSMFSGNNLDNYVVISMIGVLAACKRTEWVNPIEK